MHTNDNPITNFQRARRKDYIRDKAKKYVYNFVLNDEYTRFDSKQRFGKVRDPRSGEVVEVHKQIWRQVNKSERYKKFLESTHYQNFKHDNPGATCGYTIFM